MKKNNLRSVIFAGLLVAIGIVLSSILSISYPPNSTIIRFGIGYLPLILISIILGPKIGFSAAIIQDILGYFVYIWIYGFPAGPFYLGFTLNSILYGVIPGLVYNLKIKDINIFKYINFVFILILIGLGVWGIFNIQDIIASIEARLEEGQAFSPIIIYLMIIIGEIGLIGMLILLLKHRLDDDYSHRIILTIIILQIIITLGLTPLWVSQLYGIPFWPQLPIRIIKAPIEIFIYSILLIRLVKILNTYRIDKV
ncbi:folate family ECF transporter S component [Candidatus Izemoplasma sp. B36]|uniref:folate family ECF transporter S component n=1 Tax=Candidatus Izemoplasma sp. B36 TaxID=3242468 RepID=UPI003557590B